MSDGHSILPVREADGIFCAELSPGRLVPVRAENGDLLGTPGTCGPGWTPQFIYAGLAPVFLLEWRHIDGHQGTWYTNSSLTRVGGSDKLPPEATVAVMRQRLGVILGGIWDGLLCDVKPTLISEARDLNRVNPRTRFELIKLCQGIFSPDLLISSLDGRQDENRQIGIYNGTTLVNIDAGYVRAILQTDTRIIDKVLRGLPTGKLTWPSPVDGRPLETDAVLCVDDFRFLFRLVDEAAGLVFYVVAAEANCQVIGVLFPADKRVFTLRTAERFRFTVPTLGEALLVHVCHFAEDLVDYLNAPSRKLDCFIRGLHHGHLLFNDLAGVDELVYRVPQQFLPDFFMRGPTAASGDVEVYGKLEELFPMLRGKVDRSTTDFPSLLSRCYREHRTLVRATLEYVPRRLAQRVVQAAVDDPELRPERDLLISIRAKDWPIILYDLRVENRTLVDLAGFYARLTESLLSRVDGVALILSGHTGAYVSPSDANATKPPIQVQREIISELTDRFRGRNVKIIGNVGMGMRRTVFWSHSADIFVAPWGASLVTYRWICNKPGLIMSSKWNVLRARGPKTDIYNHSAHMEDPGPVVYLSPDFIEDDPLAPLLSWTYQDQEPESGYNFRVDEAAAFREVHRLVDENWSPVAVISGSG